MTRYFDIFPLIAFNIDKEKSVFEGFEADLKGFIIIIIITFELIEIKICQNMFRSFEFPFRIIVNSIEIDNCRYNISSWSNVSRDDENKRNDKAETGLIFYR